MRQASAQPFDALTYVDTGPVQERVYAQYAGLGWIGKNTCLINPELGSWLFLGDVITSLALEPDTPGPGAVRHLHAVPRGVSDRRPGRARRARLDPLPVLSHHRAARADSRAAAPRRSARTSTAATSARTSARTTSPRPVSSDPHWQPRPGLDAPALAELRERPDAELRRLVKGGPMTRAKLAGLRRNLDVAASNNR